MPVSTDRGSVLPGPSTGRREGGAETYGDALEEVLTDHRERGRAARDRGLAGFTLEAAAARWAVLLRPVARGDGSTGWRP